IICARAGLQFNRCTSKWASVETAMCHCEVTLVPLHPQLDISGLVCNADSALTKHSLQCLVADCVHTFTSSFCPSEWHSCAKQIAASNSGYAHYQVFVLG